MRKVFSNLLPSRIRDSLSKKRSRQKTRHSQPISFSYPKFDFEKEAMDHDEEKRKQ